MRNGAKRSSTPNRTRTGVFWLRTRHPRPLDDGGPFPYSAASSPICQADRGKQIGRRRRDDKTVSTASSIPFALPRRPFLTLSSLGLSLNKLLSGMARQWRMRTKIAGDSFSSPLPPSSLDSRECLHLWWGPWSSKPVGGLKKAVSGFDSHTLPLCSLLYAGFWFLPAAGLP